VALRCNLSSNELLDPTPKLWLLPDGPVAVFRILVSNEFLVPTPKFWLPPDGPVALRCNLSSNELLFAVNIAIFCQSTDIFCLESARGGPGDDKISLAGGVGSGHLGDHQRCVEFRADLEQGVMGGTDPGAAAVRPDHLVFSRARQKEGMIVLRPMPWYGPFLQDLQLKRT